MSPFRAGAASLPLERRPDESVLATLVGFGCHPVTTGYDMCVYSADFPGSMRRVVRSITGGECVYFQGSGGNVLPKFAFTADEAEAERMGVRLAIAALESVADRYSAPLEIVTLDEGSAMPISSYRRRIVKTDPPALAAMMETVTIPLMPHPRLEEVERLRAQYETDLDAARATGDTGKVKVAYYHAAWARKIEAQLRDGTAPTEVRGPVHAVRIGDGVVVTGPGETFTEYGIAVKALTGSAHPLRRLHERDARVLADMRRVRLRRLRGGLRVQERRPSVALFDQSVEEICVRTGVRLAERLFPDAQPWDDARGWIAAGNAPRLPPPAPLVHPSKDV